MMFSLAGSRTTPGLIGLEEPLMDPWFNIVTHEYAATNITTLKSCNKLVAFWIGMFIRSCSIAPDVETDCRRALNLRVLIVETFHGGSYNSLVDNREEEEQTCLSLVHCLIPSSYC